MQRLIKEFGFSLGEVEVLSRENDVIRFTFLHDHPGSSRKNGLEPGGRVQLRSVALVQDDQFLIFGADNKNVQGLCDALYI